jgi:surfeit locus 1 family protein
MTPAMIQRLPIIPTVIVLAAVATMIALGFWQLGRADEKARMIADYEAALSQPAEIAWPASAQYAAAYFRKTTLDCGNVRGIDSIAGTSARGQSGWIHVARCSHAAVGIADVTIGWSREPNPPGWDGGEVTGRIVPYGDTIRLVADQPQAGLAALAEPDPNDLANNHMAYVGQWFFFALTALVIYALAVRRRLKPRRQRKP